MPTQYKAGYHTSWALLVGINDYLNASPLSYACNDVDVLNDILINTLGFPAQNVFTLKDADATKRKILDQFSSFRNRAAHPDDRLLFFFAGHGFTAEGHKGQVGFLVPTDGDVTNLNSIIRWDEFSRNAELIEAKHILFLIDACYGGLALKRSVSPGSQRFLADLLQRPARQVLTAGKADQVVADGGGPHGKNSIFTGCLIEGMQGMACNSEGILTASLLMSYVYENVGQNPQSQQTPHYGHLEGDGDFIFIVPDQKYIIQELSTDYLLEMVDDKPETEEQTEIPSSKSSYANQRGYSSPEYPNFGRNDLTEKLGEVRRSQEFDGIEKAFSWFGFLIEPIANQSININISRKGADRSKIFIPGENPYEKFGLPWSLRTTANSILMSSDQSIPPYWDRFLKIDSSGNIEYGDSYHVFLEGRGYRIFKFVQIMGLTWQLLFLAKQLLQEAGYDLGVQLTFSLVGTRDTILADFSRELGEGNNIWNDPLVDSFGFDHIDDRTKCLDQHIKIEQKLVLSNLGYDNSLKLIKSIGENVGLAYNLQGAPRCFNYGTDTFPWNQYTHRRS